VNIKTRKLKVYSDFKNIPYILLKGKWLKELGFNIHDIIKVSLEKNKLVIEKEKEQSV